MLLGLERGDGAVGRDELIDRALDVVEVARIDGGEPHGVHAFEQRAELVVPSHGSAGGSDAAVGPAGHGGVGGALRPVIIVALRCKRRRGGSGEKKTTSKNAEGLHGEPTIPIRTRWGQTPVYIGEAAIAAAETGDDRSLRRGTVAAKYFKARLVLLPSADGSGRAVGP